MGWLCDLLPPGMEGLTCQQVQGTDCEGSAASGWHWVGHRGTLHGPQRDEDNGQGGPGTAIGWEDLAGV